MAILTKEEYIKAYDEFADAIFKYCYLRVSDREKAKDLTQDAFIKAWEYIEENNNIDNIKAFLYKIAGNLIIDHYRKKKSISLEKLQDDGFEPDCDSHKDINLSAEIREMLDLVEELDDKYREALLMRYVHDLSPKEIAEATGETENVISVRVNRAIKKIKKLMEHEK